MTLWLLKPIDGDPHWTPWYDKCFGIVVRAETGDEARSIAKQHGGDEDSYKAKRNPLLPSVWEDSLVTTCEPLSIDGESELIIRDLWSA